MARTSGKKRWRSRPPAALSVALGELGAGVKPGQGGRCLSQGLPSGRIVGLGPVIEEQAQIDQRVAERTLVPVEEGNDTSDICWVNQQVVEFVVIVEEG